MRISDWSSDVCSSDLIPGRDLLVRLQAQAAHYDVQVRPDTVDELRQDQDGGFTAVIGPEGVRATMVLLATGVVDRQPDNAALTDLRIATLRSEEHTSELQSLMRISYAVFCLKKK